MAGGAGPFAACLVRGWSDRAGRGAHRPDDRGDVSDHALPSGDHRPGRGHLRGAQRRPLHARARRGRAPERARGRRGLAGRGASHGEAIDIIQGLLRRRARELPGETASIYWTMPACSTGPEAKPAVVIAAGGGRASAPGRAQGRRADRDRAAARPDRGIRGGRRLRAHYAECCATPGEEDGRQQTTHHYFRWSVTGWPVLCELAGTEASRPRASTCRWRSWPNR